MKPDDYLYRIFYYDTEPLSEKGHNPVTNAPVDFATTSVAKQQIELFDDIRHTPNFALRLGKAIWRSKGWILTQDKFKSLLRGDTALRHSAEDATGVPQSQP